VRAEKGWAMRRAKRSRAQIISEDILAECPFESISPEVAFLALIRSTGHYLARLEKRDPAAIERYMQMFRESLGAARPPAAADTTMDAANIPERESLGTARPQAVAVTTMDAENIPANSPA
jgi:hypothetical protein